MQCSLVWYGHVYHEGDEVELPDDVARKYIVAGSAERVTPIVETATRSQAVETTAVYTQPFKGRRR